MVFLIAEMNFLRKKINEHTYNTYNTGLMAMGPGCSVVLNGRGVDLGVLGNA